MIKATLSRVSKFGFQTEADGKDKWFNMNKYNQDAVTVGFKKGDQVEYELKGDYVDKLVKLGSAPASASSSGTASQSSSSSSSENPSDRDLRIARESVLKVAFGALPSIHAEGDSTDQLLNRAEELAKRLLRYVTTGSFEEPEAK